MFIQDVEDVVGWRRKGRRIDLGGARDEEVKRRAATNRLGGQ
jgi:hypothetical protein